MNSMSLWPLLTVFVGSLSWVLATKGRRGSILSPFSTGLLLLVSIYGIRPLLMLNSGEFNFYGIDIQNGFTQAAFLGFAAVLALGLGYFAGILRIRHKASPPGTRSSERISRSRFDDRLVRIGPAATAAVGLLLVWIAAMIVAGGGVGFLAVLFSGRSSAVGESIQGMPAIIPVLPVIAAMLMALVRIRRERVVTLKHTEAALYWIVCALAVIPPSALGTRRFIIPTVIAALIGMSYKKWGRRFSPAVVVAAMFAFIILAIFPFVRSAGSRTGDAGLIRSVITYFENNGLSGVLDGFFLSYDTEMFNYVSYLVPRLGNGLEFGYGRGTLGDALLAPLPAVLAPFPSWSDQLLTSAFGGTCATALCPVPSVVGVLYYDLAIPGVLIGMFLIGLACSRFESWFMRSEKSSVAIGLVIAGFAPLIIRGNSISQIWIAFQVAVVLILIYAVLKRFVRRPVMEIPTRRQGVSSKSISKRAVPARSVRT
jgi:hypothetical protein